MHMMMGLAMGAGSASGPTPDEILTGAVETESGLWLCGDEGVTLVSDAVSLWTPRVGSGTFGTFGQGAAGQRPAVEAMGAHTGVLFDGTGGFGAGDYLASSLAASAWNFLHQTGFSFACVVKRNGTSGVIFDNASVNLNQRGAFLQYNSGTDDVNFGVVNGSGTALANQNFTDGLVLNDTVLIDGSWSEAAGYSLSVNNAAPVAVSLTGSPSVSDATGPLYLGAGYPGSFSFGFFTLPDLIIVPDVWSGATRASIVSALGARHGVPLADGWPAGYTPSTQDLFLV